MAEVGAMSMTSTVSSISKLRIAWPGCTDEEVETFEFLRFPYAGVPVGQQVLIDFELCEDLWALEIYPGGEKHEDVENISIFVRYRGSKEVVNAVFSMNVVDPNQDKNIPVFDCVSVTYDSEHKRWGRKKAISRKDVQSRSFSGNFTVRLSLRIVFSGTHPPDPEIKRVCLQSRDGSGLPQDLLLESATTVPSLQSDMARLLDEEVPMFSLPRPHLLHTRR
jgi:hypothetical protein